MLAWPQAGSTLCVYAIEDNAGKLVRYTVLRQRDALERIADRVSPVVEDEADEVALPPVNHLLWFSGDTMSDISFQVSAHAWTCPATVRFPNAAANSALAPRKQVAELLLRDTRAMHLAPCDS